MEAGSMDEAGDGWKKEKTRQHLLKKKKKKRGRGGKGPQTQPDETQG